MNQITTSLDQPFVISDASQAVERELVNSIVKHNRAVAELSGQVEALRATSPSDWSPADEAVAAKYRGRQIDLLNEEIAIRGEIESFYKTLDGKDRPAAVDAAQTEYENAKATVLEKLLEMGFVDGIVPGTGTLIGIAPGTVERHPVVHAAKQTYEALSSYNPRPNRQANQQAIQSAQGKLASIKSKALAMLA